MNPNPRPDMSSPASPAKPAGPALAGQILKVAYVGSHFEYNVHTALGTLFAIDRVGPEPESNGSEVWLSFADRGVTIIPK